MFKGLYIIILDLLDAFRSPHCNDAINDIITRGTPDLHSWYHMFKLVLIIWDFSKPEFVFVS